MGNRKRGLHSRDSIKVNFFKSKLVLNSLKSKVAFAFIVLMFGVVISIGIWDVVEKVIPQNFESFL